MAMKKYFTKLLPIEGEIKEGDKYINPALSGTFVRGKHDNSSTSFSGNDSRSGYKKAKLFLCSRDIQVGDKFNSANGVGFVCSKIDAKNVYSIGGLNHPQEEVAHSRIYSYKVIGEISPNATWVKEGGEFEEHEIKFTVINILGYHEPFYLSYHSWTSPSIEGYRKYISILCPNCKTFH